MFLESDNHQGHCYFPTGRAEHATSRFSSHCASILPDVVTTLVITVVYCLKERMRMSTYTTNKVF